ncbi:MAG TPA: SRPBCC domain-containing protein [Caulobacteraceae bacterium]|nr:SRPBCC domain-containing protein [Caulobacteraceae bacterium]
MLRAGLATAAAALALAGAARAEVVDAQPNGFEVRQSVTIAAPPAKVWAALVQPGQWWNSAHSWSGDAKNLRLDARAGGCWCETLPNGGGAAHLRVIYVEPGKALRLEGALGPFQFSGATGHLVWTLKEDAGKTVLTQTYDLGGYMQGGLGTHAPAVDGVLTDAITRLKAFVETGKPG